MGVENWKGNEFRSSTMKTREFKAFSKDFKRFVKKNIPEDAEIKNYSTGHFYVSGFIKRNNNYVYFSTSDVRHFKDEWATHMLIRK